MSEQRRRDITSRVAADGRVGLADLARQFGVSQMTIRRDLDDLTDRGALQRVRGGAVAVGAGRQAPDPGVRSQPTTKARRPVDDLFGPPPPAPITSPAGPRPDARPEPARTGSPPASRAVLDLAARLAHAPSVILDAGPDAVALARALHEVETSAGAGSTASQLIITRDPAVADAVSAHPARRRVLLTGGEPRPGEPGLLGPWALAPLSDVHASAAVLTATGIEATGWWCPSPEAAQWAREAATRADTLTLWVSATALGARGLARAGDPRGVHRVVVSGALPREALAGDALAALVEAGTEVVLGR